jgi:hypothetical protein
MVRIHGNRIVGDGTVVHDRIRIDGVDKHGGLRVGFVMDRDGVDRHGIIECDTSGVNVDWVNRHRVNKCGVDCLVTRDGVDGRSQ